MARVPKATDVTIARIVHYSLTDGPSLGQCRPAVVTAVHDHGVVNLMVIADGGNDGNINLWRPSSQHDGDSPTQGSKNPGTWHWHEECRL